MPQGALPNGRATAPRPRQLKRNPHLIRYDEISCSHIPGFADSRAAPAVAAQSKTYPETRKLLLEMDYAHLDSNFKRLFEQAIPRKPDLIHALYDDEKRVCLNAQIVMKYLAEPEMLAAINQCSTTERNSDGTIGTLTWN